MSEAPSELVPCPACGEMLHRRAVLCPHCGYAPEITAYQDQLSSLSTVCSILTGFGLASLVTLALDEDRIAASWLLRITAGAWLVSSLLLLMILILAELLRRQEVSDAIVHMPRADRERFARRCERLLSIFSIALVAMAFGFVLLGFHFSWVHGVIAVAGVGLTVLVTWSVMG
jgi:hypothetical protein